MTAQELFTKVVTHLAQQGKQSADGYSCLYRGPNGLKCAVGCLIADEDYDEHLEAVRVRTLVHDRKLAPALRPHVELLTDLQIVHDSCNPGQWEYALTALAVKCGLRIPELDWSNCKG